MDSSGLKEEDPEQPFAPADHRIPSDRDDEREPISGDFSLPDRKGCLKWCGCVSALLLILSLVLLVLLFTVLKVKDPILKLNSIALYGLNTTTTAAAASLSNVNGAGNFTVVIDVSVKNPNVAAFRYGDGTTEIYYGGVAVGGGRNPGGVVGAGRTVRMNATAEVMTWKFSEVPRLGEDLRTGEIRVNGCTRVGGRVKIAKLITKHVVVTMNCSFTMNLKTTQIQIQIQDQNCHQKVSAT